MIKVENLTKDFDQFRAVDQISFAIPKGQILGFLGPNGAGKSTTMKMLTGFIEPTSGSAWINGFDVVSQSLQVRQQIGYLPESAPSYGEMTVREFLSFIGEVRQLFGNRLYESLERMRHLCALQEVWDQSIETLSKGYKQRVGFAQSLIHDPPVLILDEPTDGLDPNQKHEVRKLIKSMGRDKTIILSTHILEEVEAVCERAIIIANGQIVADATPEKLLAQSSIHNAVTIKFATDHYSEEFTQLEKIQGVHKVERLESACTVRVYPKNGSPIVNDISQLVNASRWQVAQIQVEKGRLDEVFRRVTLGGVKQ